MNRIWKISAVHLQRNDQLKRFNANFAILKMSKSLSLTPIPTLGPGPGALTTYTEGNALEIS